MRVKWTSCDGLCLLIWYTSSARNGIWPQNEVSRIDSQYHVVQPRKYNYHLLYIFIKIVLVNENCINNIHLITLGVTKDIVYSILKTPPDILMHTESWWYLYFPNLATMVVIYFILGENSIVYYTILISKSMAYFNPSSCCICSMWNYYTFNKPRGYKCYFGRWIWSQKW